jgi:hypothetical protein
LTAGGRNGCWSRSSANKIEPRFKLSEDERRGKLSQRDILGRRWGGAKEGIAKEASYGKSESEEMGNVNHLYQICRNLGVKNPFELINLIS